MYYVMSDIHGQQDMFKEMLSKISFGHDDKLYILGDICDRGPCSAQLYLDVMSRRNVFCIKGNHELLAEAALKIILPNLGKTDFSQCIYHDDVILWMENGGDTTLESFLQLDMSQMTKIFNFIKDMPYYKHLKVNGREFVLAHAGLGNFNNQKPLDAYVPWELVWVRPNFNDKLFNVENKYLIVGHTPTPLLSGSAKIYHGAGDIIDIDCGAVFTDAGGKLGCLCLDTMEEFYV